MYTVKFILVRMATFSSLKNLTSKWLVLSVVFWAEIRVQLKWLRSIAIIKLISTVNRVTHCANVILEMICWWNRMRVSNFAMTSDQ